MRCGDFVVQAPLILGGHVSEAEILAVDAFPHAPGCTVECSAYGAITGHQAAAICADFTG